MCKFKNIYNEENYPKTFKKESLSEFMELIFKLILYVCQKWKSKPHYNKFYVRKFEYTESFPVKGQHLKSLSTTS